MALPETFTQFARTAAEQLRWKKARPLVEDELLTHLCDQRDALMAGGMDETVATAESLRLTGDPYEIGTELDRVHRPKTPKLLFALAALIALAGLAFTALVSFRDYELTYFAVHQSVALLLGTAAMLAAYFLDFTLLGRFALPLALMFHAALILLGLLPIGGFWLRYIYVSTHILLRGLPLLFPLMFAVLLYALRGRHGWGVFAAFVCLAVQCMFCLRVPCLLDLGFLFLCDSALLIFCANTALCNTRLYRRPRFRPMAAVCAAGLTQLPYLIQRGGRQWALCMAALALLYGAAALLPDLLPESAAEQADKRRAWFLLLLGVCAVPAGWTVMGFSPAAVLTAVLLLYFVGRGPAPDAAAAGALAGLTLDLCGTGELYLAVVLCAAASAAAGLRGGQRLPAAAAFCAAGVLAALLLGEVRPLAVLCQLLTAAGVWLLLPEKEGMLLTAAGEVSPEAAAPAAAALPLRM